MAEMRPVGCRGRKQKLTTAEAERIVCELLAVKPHASLTEISRALGVVCSKTARVYLSKIRQSTTSLKTLAFLDERAQRFRVYAGKRTPHEVIEAILGLRKDLGRTPRMADLDHRLRNHALRQFSTWNRALEAAGLSPNRITLTRDSDSREEVFSDALRRVASIIGHPPTETEYEKARKARTIPSLPYYRVGYRLFGSWRKTLHAAGFQVVSKKVQREEALRSTIAFHKQCGRTIVSARELPGLHSDKIKAANLAGIKLVRVQSRMAWRLDKVARLGFPEIEGNDRGRQCALRAAQGENLVSIGASYGLSRERIRQLIAAYASWIAETDSGELR